MFVFFIYFVGYLIILSSDLKQKEKIYLNSLNSRKYLNSQLEIISNHSRFLKQNKILQRRFDSSLFHEDFLQNSMDNEKSECAYSQSYQFIGNLNKNLNLKNLDYRESIKKIVFNSLSPLLTNYFIQANQIKILAIRKIILPNTYKIDFSIYCFMNNYFNFLNRVVKLKNSIIINSFNLQLMGILTKQYKQNIIFSLIINMPFNISKDDFKSKVEQAKVAKYSLRQIKFLGFLSDNIDQTFGLIGLPNKKICKITLGNYLGIEQGLVIGIYPDKIIIKKNKSNKIMSLSNKPRKISYENEFS